MVSTAAQRLLLLRYTLTRQRRKAAVKSWILQNPQAFEVVFKQKRYRYRPVLSYRPGTFQLDEYDDTFCKEHMRFCKAEIRQFLPFLALDQVKYRHRCQATPEVAICLVLWRLSYLRRYKDTQDIFGHSKTLQCVIFNDTILHLVERFRTLLFWDEQRLTIPKLQKYAERVGARCGADRVWGFVDGTIRAICCASTIPQRPLYSGYTRYHCVKFQIITTLDGLTASCDRPNLGSIGD